MICRTAIFARVFTALSLLLLCLSGCGTAGDLAPTTSPTADPNAIFGYRSGTELGLVRGNQVVARASGYFLYAPPQFTEDGRYLFSYSQTGGNSIVVIDTETNKVATRPIPAMRIAPGLGSTVVWWENPNRLVSLDLSNPASVPTVSRKIDLPPVAPDWSPTVRVVAARGGTVLLARLDGPHGTAIGPDNLYLARDTGAITALGSTEGDEPTNEAYISPNGRLISYVTSRRQCGRTAVAVIDVEKGTTESVPSPGDVNNTRVIQLWWDANNSLHTSIADKRCVPPNSPSDPFQNIAIWTLTGGKWKHDDTNLYEKREISPTVTAVLAPGQDNGTKLSVRTGDVSEDIADNVRYITTPVR